MYDGGWVYNLDGTCDRFSCFVLLVFSYPATSWPGPSVSCSVEDKDRLVIWESFLFSKFCS